MSEKQIEKNKKKIPAHTWISVVVICLMIPVVLLASRYFGNRKYYLCSMLLIILSMVPFFLSFEKRKPEAREIVTLAVMCAIAVASRAAFIMLPHFKPLVGIVIITGMAFGAESGFLTGASVPLSVTLFLDRDRGPRGRCLPMELPDFWQGS